MPLVPRQRPSRSNGLVLLAALTALTGLTAVGASGCAAGIQAETSRERPTINSVGGAVGAITLRNVYVGGPGRQGGSIPVLFAAFNGGNDPDQLTGVSSPVAAQAAAPSQLTVAPGEATYYNPGSSTPRLTGLRNPLRVGQQVAVTLTFQRAGSVTLEVPVEAVPEADLSASPSPSASRTPPATPATKAPATKAPATKAPATPAPASASTTP